MVGTSMPSALSKRGYGSWTRAPAGRSTDGTRSRHLTRQRRSGASVLVLLRGRGGGRRPYETLRTLCAPAAVGADGRGVGPPRWLSPIQQPRQGQGTRRSL